MVEQSILAALDDALRTGDEVDEVIGAFFRMAKQSDDATKSNMLESLDAPMRAFPVERVSPVALLAGAFVEIGADPRRFPTAVFDHLVALLTTLDGASDDAELPEYYYLLERSAMACLSRSAQLRRTHPHKRAILAKLGRYRERYGFLGKMVQVLDDEPLVVLHPTTTRGFRFHMHGIADNFQLHSLLLGALAGDGPKRIRGSVPPSEVTAAMSNGSSDGCASAQSDWQLASWTGLRGGGDFTQLDRKGSWIWNEGVPADIELFEGTRVVLIGESTIQRSWNAQRVFPGMNGRLDGPELLSPAVVGAMLDRMRAS